MDLFDYFLWSRASDKASEATRRARLAQTQSRRRHVETQERIEDLEKEVGELSLFVRALFRLLVERGQVTREGFADVLRAVDASDGAVDGRYTGRPDTP